MRVGGESDVGAGVLQHQRPLEEVLHRADALDDVAQRLLVERHRQQVVRVAAEHAGPAEVVGDPGRPHRAAASALSLPRYSKSSGSVLPIDSDTPCMTTG